MSVFLFRETHLSLSPRFGRRDRDPPPLPILPGSNIRNTSIGSGKEVLGRIGGLGLLYHEFDCLVGFGPG